MKERASGEIPTMILRHLGDGTCQTIDQLDAALPLNRRQISDGAAMLIKRDYLDRIEAGCYCLTPSGLAAAHRGERITSGPLHPHTGKCRRPHRDTFRQRAWNAMRMSVTFTIGDLAIVAAKDDKDPESNLVNYLGALRRVGYVTELPVRQSGTHLTSNGFKRFRLLKDTGPVAPVWRAKKRAIWDYNLDGLVGEVSCAR
ncbi:hypothetical protein GJU94_02380 [Brucella sp. 10RB9214]|uniref:hypothetical protein n=1 Tax=Brucella sp. 10RB9214 TaxID=1844040 RepID=UPI0012AE7CD1|nr:hypothetical protein [Brucella sp. 10RB9214]MRN48686.1 hypothetical protein [Brucella sp. 10RB9214]